MSESIYEVNQDNTAWREVDGEVVVINAATTRYYSLNKTGSYLWRLLLEGGAAIDYRARKLSAHYQKQAGVAASCRSLCALAGGRGADYKRFFFRWRGLAYEWVAGSRKLQLVEQGTQEELMAQDGLYEHLYRLHARFAGAYEVEEEAPLSGNTNRGRGVSVPVSRAKA